MVWAIGASTLTWGHRKSTWLFLSLVIANAAITSHRDESVALVQGDVPETQVKPHTEHSEWPRGAKEKPHFG
jgi:hypothetical protein